MTSRVASRPTTRHQVNLAFVTGAALLLVAAATIAIPDVVPPLVTAGLGAAGLGVILLARPDLATVIVIGLIFSNAAVIGARLHGLPYAVPALLPALLGLPLGQRLLLRREPLIIPPPFIFVLAYAAVELLSALLSRDPGGAAVELQLVMTEGLLLYLLVVNVIRTPWLLKAAVVTVVTIGAGLSILSIVQQATGSFSNIFFGFAQVEDPRAGLEASVATTGGLVRAAGPIGEQNFYAQILLALVPLGVALAKIARTSVGRLVMTTMSLLIAAGMAVTFSRGAAVGLAAILPVMALTRLVTRRALVLTAFGALLMLSVLPGYADRLTTIGSVGGATQIGGGTDPVIQQRTNDVLAATLVFLDHPLLGVGPGLFRSYYQEYAPRAGGLPGDRDYAAHSLYAEVAAETGVMGLLTFGGIVISTAVMLIRVRRDSLRPEHVALATGFLVVLVAYLATGVFLHISYHRYIWLFLALAAAAGTVLRADTPPNRTEPTDAGEGPGAGRQTNAAAQHSRSA